MTRGVSSANEAAMSSAVVRPVRFVELQFASGTVYVWSGAGNFSWNGHTWIGLGDLASCSPVEEGADLGSRSIDLTLSGLPSSVIALALGHGYRGRPAFVYDGFLNESGALTDTPITSWAGRMDSMPIALDGATGSVTVRIKSRLADLGRARVRYYSDADQQRRFPGDRFFEYTVNLAERPLPWGIKTPTTPGGSFGGTTGIRPGVAR